MNLGLSDIAQVNFGAHKETAGFGGVDQSLNDRRLDDYEQYNVAVQADLGRFLPEKAKLRAPIYYSVSKEKTTPKYNPLDQDVLLKDALDDAPDKHSRDSIMAYAVERSTIQSFSISGLKFDVRSPKPMPWDPANFTINFSFNKQAKSDPVTEYENTNDYRGSFAYNYTPMIKGLRPLGWLNTKNRNLKFFKEWELNYLPNSISFLTTMSRYYYEQQTRSEMDAMFQLPVSVSKNFLWDRQFQITWNLTKSINLSFNSNTSARIEETIGAVNKKLFPDRYKEWKDTVWQSIRSLGTPWAYNQAVTATYRAPFSRIPVLDFLTGSVSYNATYRWDRGADVDGISMGNTIASQSSLSADGRINFETLYNKIPFVKDVNKRFANSRRSTTPPKKPKKFERTYKLRPDTTFTIRHNLRNKKVKITAVTADDSKPFVFKHKVVDANTVEILTPSDKDIKFTIEEVLKEDKSVWREIGEYALRLAMSPRQASIRWKRTSTMTIPLFRNGVGDIFGQSTQYGPMSPGLDFAFGFAGEDYIYKAKDRGWLITDDGQTSPALWSRANELNLEFTVEPVKGLKVQLTMNRTDNRTNQVQFMYADMPITRSGSYTKTHCAIATALGSSNAASGYYSAPFQKMLDYIPVIADRYTALYNGVLYPAGGFMDGNPLSGQPFNPQIGGVSETSSDVLIPAFLAAYTGTDVNRQYLDPFPSFRSVLPNWRVTYDGLINLGNLRNIFKSFTINHAYQCTYTVGSYNSYLNWLGTGAGDLGFTLDELSGQPIPSSPYNISTVSISERFAPLFGVSTTLKNELQFNAEWRDQRTLTLNTSAGQLVEATTRGLTMGVGYKIVGFNTVLKMKGSQSGVSNDLTVNADFSLQNTQALIRRIESNYTQATSGTRTLSIQFNASYILSRRITLAAYFDHQVNTPLVSNAAYPTSSSSYGLSLNLNLAR